MARLPPVTVMLGLPQEEMRSYLQCAEQTHLENVAAALRRVLAKPSHKG
jgi:hypothetical protein